VEPCCYFINDGNRGSLCNGSVSTNIRSDDTEVIVMVEDHRKKLKEYKQDESKKPKYVNDDTGTCDLCGEWSSKLIDEVCAPCRTQWKIK
jgi:hypothetical protein